MVLLNTYVVFTVESALLSETKMREDDLFMHRCFNNVEGNYYYATVCRVLEDHKRMAKRKKREESDSDEESDDQSRQEFSDEGMQVKLIVCVCVCVCVCV